MKTIIQVIVVGLLAMNFPFSFADTPNKNGHSTDDNNGNSDGVVIPPVPVHPPPPICAGFPGSPMWNECWNNWRNLMQIFEHQMLEYQAKLSQLKINGTNDGATSAVHVNGYAIRTNGFGINSQTNNGRIDVDIYIGKHEKVAMNQTDHKIRWDVFYPANTTKWITLQPPSNVNLTSINHEVKDDRILISGPASGHGTSIISSAGGAVGIGSIGSII